MRVKARVHKRSLRQLDLRIGMEETCADFSDCYSGNHDELAVMRTRQNRLWIE